MAMFSEDLFSIFEEESDSKAAASKKRSRDKNEGGPIKLKRPKSDAVDGSESAGAVAMTLGAGSDEESRAQTETVVPDEPVVREDQAAEDDTEEPEEKEEQ